MADWGFETRQVHAGAVPDPTTGARAVPIYQTTSYVFRDTAHAAALFGLEELGMIYTRIMNPTQAVFEERMTALDGGVGALATASGQAAETIALLNLAENGGHIVASASLYGGTYNLLHYTLPKLGVAVTFIDDPDDLAAWKAAIRPETRAFYGETHRQPEGRRLRLRRRQQDRARQRHPARDRQHRRHPVPLPAVASRRRHRRVLGDEVHRRSRHVDRRRSSSTAVSSTTSRAVGSPTSPSPIRRTTVSCSRSFPEPLRPAQYILKARLQYQRDIGPAIAPLNSFLFLQGLETLSLRMERHVQNAQAVAEWLEARDEVEWVAFPGLKSSKWNKRAKQYLPNGAGAIMAFGIKGGMDAGRRFIEGLELFSHLANVGAGSPTGWTSQSRRRSRIPRC